MGWAFTPLPERFGASFPAGSSLLSQSANASTATPSARAKTIAPFQPGSLRPCSYPRMVRVVIEAECDGGAADAVLARQLDSQVPQRLGNTSAPLPPLPPGFKPGPGLGQILW